MTTVQGETGVLAGDERMLSDGELQHTASGATFDVIHPATDGTVEDMVRAVGAARRAWTPDGWRSRELREEMPWFANSPDRRSAAALSGE